ncbi:hypothetical protein Taro_049103 [Colocasia esculenta]|uniref:Uncharacterized protein n=1 Tax=Colocasia esculenta TaxID=4460 RepID=A0A843XA43_COLES|nr:hypothetical protein [Colocasia esculenta]
MANLMVNFGKMHIDFVHTICDVSLAEITEFLKAYGSPPTNVAIIVVHLNSCAAFIDKLVIVDIRICFDTGAHTTLTIITLRADDKQEFMLYSNPSTDILPTKVELNLNLILRARIFHYRSKSLITKTCRLVNLRAMEVAKEAGTLLSYDPNLWLPL